MNNKAIYKKNKEIEYTVIDEETIILIPKTGEFFSLNKTGTGVFKLINGKNYVESIVKLIAKKYCKKTGLVEKDILVLLKELNREKIILKTN